MEATRQVQSSSHVLGQKQRESFRHTSRTATATVRNSSEFVTVHSKGFVKPTRYLDEHAKNFLQSGEFPPVLDKPAAWEEYRLQRVGSNAVSKAEKCRAAIVELDKKLPSKMEAARRAGPSVDGRFKSGAKGLYNGSPPARLFGEAEIKKGNELVDTAMMMARRKDLVKQLQSNTAQIRHDVDRGEREIRAEETKRKEREAAAQAKYKELRSDYDSKLQVAQKAYDEIVQNGMKTHELFGGFTITISRYSWNDSKSGRLVKYDEKVETKFRDAVFSLKDAARDLNGHHLHPYRYVVRIPSEIEGKAEELGITVKRWNCALLS